MTAMKKLQPLVDGMSEQEAKTLLDLVEGASSDPLMRALDAAPLDDEPTSPEEDAAHASRSPNMNAARVIRRTRSSASWVERRLALRVHSAGAA